MASLLRRMTGKTAEMKKAKATLTDDEFEEMFDLKKLPEPIRNVSFILFLSITVPLTLSISAHCFPCLCILFMCR